MAFKTSDLSQENILRDVHDPVNQVLRTTATLSGATVEVDLDFQTDSVAVGDPISGAILKINTDGSVNSNVEIDAAGGDNIAISNGVNILDIAADGSIKTNDAIAQTSLSAINAKLTSSSGRLIIDGSQVTQPVSVATLPLPTNAATETSAVAGNSILSSINTKLDSLQVSVVNFPTQQKLNGFSTTNADTVQLVGSVDGTSTGTKLGFVNNKRQQILAAADRQQLITYADFGTKDQRIVQVTYSSATFPGTQLQKVINYTLVGNFYRRDSINWNLI